MAQEALASEGTPAPAEGEPKAPEPKPEGGPKGEPKVFDEEYVKQLRNEAASHRKRAQEAEAKNAEHEEADKSELEKAQGKATKAEQAQADAEAKLLRFEVASEKEVPAKLVPLLTATTKGDLEAQADLILDNAKPTESKPDFDGGARESAPNANPETAHNENVLAMLGLKPK